MTCKRSCEISAVQYCKYAKHLSEVKRSLWFELPRGTRMWFDVKAIFAWSLVAAITLSKRTSVWLFAYSCAGLCGQDLQYVSKGLHAETKRTLAHLQRKTLEPQNFLLWENTDPLSIRALPSVFTFWRTTKSRFFGSVLLFLSLYQCTWCVCGVW